MTTTLAPQPLSLLSEEESMFRDAVRDFAESEIRPHVHEMDEAGEFRPDLITRFFEMGLMGIEVPEQYGGAGGTILMASVGIEELARVDASAAIYVDVQNTLCNNALLRWANDEQKQRFLPRMCSSRLGEPVPGLVTWSAVAWLISTLATSDGDADGLDARYRAATPATCGDAIDVPLQLA